MYDLVEMNAMDQDVEWIIRHVLGGEKLGCDTILLVLVAIKSPTLIGTLCIITNISWTLFIINYDVLDDDSRAWHKNEAHDLELDVCLLSGFF